MGWWLYLADILHGVSVITLLTGCLCIGYVLVSVFILSTCPEDIVGYGRLEEEEVELEEQLKIIERFRKRAKKIAIVGSFLICLTLFIPTKEEFIQIKLLNEVNMENYEFIKQEIEAGTEKIMELINKDQEEGE